MLSSKHVISLTAACMLFVASNTQAQPTGYIGGALGQSDVDVSGYDTATAFQLFGGMNLTENFALELAYTNLGEFDVSGASNTYIEVDGFEITAVGSFPISNMVSFFGEAGLYMWNVDATLFGSSFGSDDGTDLTYGIGARFNVADPLKLHVEWQRYSNVSDADIDTFYAGLTYGF